MSVPYKLLYRVGLTPWERLPMLPAAEQISPLFDREENGRQPPYGQALDLGCGSGIWSVELARRGWQVTGVDMVPKAVRADELARQAGVEARFLEGHVTALRGTGVGSGLRLVLDFGRARPHSSAAPGGRSRGERGRRRRRLTADVRGRARPQRPIAARGEP